MGEGDKKPQFTMTRLTTLEVAQIIVWPTAKLIRAQAQPVHRVTISPIESSNNQGQLTVSLRAKEAEPPNPNRCIPNAI
ncbi:hypothetical protein J6590_030284 [Homalodisca vitripennis]|nr:hypothetical protein J6590_030284 [Homalodisca vitripennis]